MRLNPSGTLHFTGETCSLQAVFDEVWLGVALLLLGAICFLALRSYVLFLILILQGILTCFPFCVLCNSEASRGYAECWFWVGSDTLGGGSSFGNVAAEDVRAVRAAYDI